MIKRKFDIDREYIRNEYKSEKNRQNRKDYFSKYNEEERELIKERYFYELEVYFQENIFFFDWFSQQDESSKINMLTQWPKRKNSEHAPLSRIPAKVEIEGKEHYFIASPIKTGREVEKENPSDSQVNLEDIRKIYEQNNYSNLMLYNVVLRA